MIYRVWNSEETREVAKSFEAVTEEAAAEDWAAREDWESVEFSIARGETVVVIVENEAGEKTTYAVTGEMRPWYSASKYD